MLDLGVWMSIQCAVQKVHHIRHCNHDVLSKSIQEAWDTNISERAFKNVFNRLGVVLSCIVDDDGGNQLVEKKRGKLFRDANIIDLTNGDENEENRKNNNIFTKNIIEIDDFEEENEDIYAII